MKGLMKLVSSSLVMAVLLCILPSAVARAEDSCALISTMEAGFGRIEVTINGEEFVYPQPHLHPGVFDLSRNRRWIVYSFKDEDGPHTGVLDLWTGLYFKYYANTFHGINATYIIHPQFSPNAMRYSAVVWEEGVAESVIIATLGKPTLVALRESEDVILNNFKWLTDDYLGVHVQDRNGDTLRYLLIDARTGDQAEITETQFESIEVYDLSYHGPKPTGAAYGEVYDCLPPG